MRPRLFLYAVPALLAWAAAARAQQPASPADLFPAKVLAYAELRQPGPLAQEIAALFHGSVLANVPDSLAKFQDKLGKERFRGESHRLGAIGLALSPAVLKEVGRIKGAAAAFLGMDSNGEPEYLAVVLPGDSLALTFFMRAYLTVDARPIGKVDGVMLYHAASYRQVRQEGVVVREHGPVLAMTADALFVGSPAAVKDAVRRLKGHAGAASLARSKRFQEASREAANEPGLFTYADPAALFEVIQQIPVPGHLADIVQAINPKAFRSVFDSLTLSNGTLHYYRTVLLNPSEKSPLLEILPNAPADLSLLGYVPKDAVLAVALSNAGGAKRWPKLLEFVDQIARVSGAREPAPSEAVRQVEQALGIDFANDVAGKIKTIGFALGNLQTAPVRKVVRKGPGFESGSSGPEVPALFLVEATDADAAKKLTEDILPKFVRLMSHRQGLEATHKTIKGQTVNAMKMAEHEHIHYGRHGKTIVLALYEEPVALALASGAAKDGWLAEAKLAGRLQKLDQPIALAVAKPVSGLMGAFFMTGSAYYRSTPAPQVDKGVAPPPAKQDAPGDQRVKVTAERGPAQLGPEEQKMMKELSKLLAKEQPLVFSVTRQADRIRAEGTLGGLRELVPVMTDFVIEQALRVRTVAERGRP